MSSIDRLFGGDRSIPGMRNVRKHHAFVPANDASDDSPIDGEMVAEDAGVVKDFASFRQSPDDVTRKGTAEGAYDASSQPVHDGERAPDDAEFPAPTVTVEPLKVKPAAELLIAHDPTHRHSENVRLLRTELLLRHSAWETANMVAVVSPSAGEGRSRLAAELALAFAQLQRPTLLVDVDMRRPRLHTLFGANLGDGLAQALVGNGRPVMSRVEGFPSLSLLTAGDRAANALEMLTDERFERLMEQWRLEYDFVVLDTPPVMEFADAVAVATVAGRVLTVSRARQTPYSQAREMLRRLSATDCEVLGGVLNHF